MGAHETAGSAVFLSPGFRGLAFSGETAPDVPADRRRARERIVSEDGQHFDRDPALAIFEIVAPSENTASSRWATAPRLFRAAALSRLDHQGRLTARMATTNSKAGR